MKKRYIQILIFLCLTILFFPARTTAQKSSEGNLVTVESVVKDEKGNPVPGAVIYGNEGSVTVKTDAAGKFTISVPAETDLLIESEGYEPAVFKSGEVEKLEALVLKTSLFLYAEKDAVNIAFGKTKYGSLVNAVSVINPDEIRKYDNIQSVADALSGRVPGLLGYSNMRGIGGPMVLVDGLPREMSTLNVAEVEQITILKDVNSSVLYGNGAVTGVIQITTKRGQAYKNRVDVSGHYGVLVPTALPKYLSSADYMEYYNEAKRNDGLAEPYTAADISNYRTGNPYRYPSTDYYSKEYLKDYRPFSRVMTELSGGNKVATYYTNIGWDQSGNLLNFGAGKKGSNNKFNVRGNVDMNINSWIKSSLDATAIIVSNSGQVGDYWTAATTYQPNLFSPLLPFDLIKAGNTTLKARKNDVDGKYLLGGRSDYLTNPIANGFSGGENEYTQRYYSFNNRVDFDLDKITEGLAFHTNVSFDFYTLFNQTISNSYSVYVPTWDSAVDSITALQQLGTDTRTGSQNVSGMYYERRFGFYGMFDYNRTFNNVHNISAALLGYGTRFKKQDDFQGNKNFNLGLRMAYSYKNKLMADFSGAYVNSVKLPMDNRRAFSPSLGLAWVLIADKDLTSTALINYLKVRASAGIMNSEAGIDNFYVWENRTGPSGSYNWNEGAWSNSGTVSVHGANPNLGFEKRSDINLGATAVLFGRHLTVDANIFKSEYYDQITRPSTVYPSFYANFIPYENFDSNQYEGAEIGISYNKTMGDFSYTLGVNALYANSKVLKRDEIWADDYQYRKGQPLDARYGLVADGFFDDQAEIDNHALQAFGTVKPGDIKYVDQNDDGIIDDNDQIRIGRGMAPYSYGVNFRLSYKNFHLFAKGNGSTGSDGYISDNYYWVDGNDKYSEVVKNRWTPETAATATMPRLSSTANNNNFRSSTFWLYKDNYFTLDRLQLTCDMPEDVTRMLKMKYLSFHLTAANIVTVSKFKAYRELAVGAREPNYRSFSIGLKTTF